MTSQAYSPAAPTPAVKADKMKVIKAVNMKKHQPQCNKYLSL